jgi:hypothetical protein
VPRCTHLGGSVAEGEREDGQIADVRSFERPAHSAWGRRRGGQLLGPIDGGLRDGDTGIVM